MPISRPLIFATAYCATAERLRIIELWARVTKNLNPDCDILLIDSASPVNLQEVCTVHGIEFFSFPDNIGHLNLTGRDGWGRAFCHGVQMAIDRGYEYFSNLDADLIFCKPVTPIIERMRRDGVKVCAPMDVTYLFVETAVSFYETAYMRESRFIERYDWQHPEKQLGVPPERRCELLFGDDLWTLPLRGYRNDYNQVTFRVIKDTTPYGLDFLTHAKDFSLYHQLLAKNGVTV